MLVNLSDVLTTEGKQADMEVPLEMDCFESRMGSFPIKEKSPVKFTFTNIGKGKARIEGNVELLFQTNCDRCLEEVPTRLSLQFERVAASPEITNEDELVDDLSFMEGYQLNVEIFVYNEIIGNWPAKILCKEDCKGFEEYEEVNQHKHCRDDANVQRPFAALQQLLAEKSDNKE